MRKRAFPFIMLVLVTACTSKNAGDKTASPEKNQETNRENYSYIIDHPDNWDINTDTKNTAVALKSVKSFEMGTADSALYFADNVEINSDYFSFKGSREQAAEVIAKNRKLAKKMRIEMHNWLSVISKDKSEEWVTLWYTTIATDRNNKTDSASYISDLKLTNGKITQLDTYTRHFARRR